MSLAGWDIGPRSSEPADILLDHARVNWTLVGQYIHPDAVFVTSVREPISWFRSAVAFWPEVIDASVSVSTHCHISPH